jgi:hypothetical protein
MELREEREEEDLGLKLSGLRLSEAERRGVKGAWLNLEEGGGKVQVVGKLFAEKPGRADGIAQTLGKIWCPIKGIKCKELGNNFFLITFLQSGGKRRALEEGPWDFGGDLFLVKEYEGSSSLEDLEFHTTPCWVRVMKLPLGLMNKATGLAIGESLGTFLEVETEEDEVAIGLFLRVKVLLDIHKPLQRGVIMELNEKGDKIWCPVVYEFLPNFCYICGRLGHTDKSCDIKSSREKRRPYSGDLRIVPSRRRSLEENRGRGSDGSGSGGGKWEKSQGSGSKQSWKIAIRSESGSAKAFSDCEKGEESTNPLKIANTSRKGGVPQKLDFGPVEDMAGKDHINKEGYRGKSSEKADAKIMGNQEAQERQTEKSEMRKELDLVSQPGFPKSSIISQDTSQQDGVEGEMDVDGQEAEVGEEMKKSSALLMAPELSFQKKGTFKRRRNERKGNGGEAAAQGGSMERKRQAPEEIDVDSLGPKKLKWAGDLSVTEDKSRGSKDEMEMLIERAGLHEQFRLAK